MCEFVPHLIIIAPRLCLSASRFNKERKTRVTDSACLPAAIKGVVQIGQEIRGLKGSGRREWADGRGNSRGKLSEHTSCGNGNDLRPATFAQVRHVGSQDTVELFSI